MCILTSSQCDPGEAAQGCTVGDPVKQLLLRGLGLLFSPVALHRPRPQALTEKSVLPSTPASLHLLQWLQPTSTHGALQTPGPRLQNADTPHLQTCCFSH